MEGERWTAGSFINVESEEEGGRVNEREREKERRRVIC